MSNEPKRRPLGRGLSALLGEAPAPPPAPAALPAETTQAGGVRSLPIEQLRPGRYQPRKRFDDEALLALVESVREKGIIQPLVVRRDPDRADGWEIVAGERRWRAAQAAGIHAVPVVVRELADREALEIALVENVQRQDLSALEEAEGYRRLIDEFGHRQEDLARAVGKSRSHIANTLRLLALPEAVRALLLDGKLTVGHARALLNAENPGAIAQKIVALGLNVRQAEQLAAGARPGGAKSETKPKPPARGDADTRALERSLEQQLGLKVQVDHDGPGGRLTLHYRTLDQLDDVLKKLGG